MAQEKGSRQHEGRSGRLLRPISAEAASSPRAFFFSRVQGDANFEKKLHKLAMQLNEEVRLAD